jgi:hypothetical protein
MHFSSFCMFGGSYKLWISSSLCSLLHPPSTSSILGPSIILLNLCSFPSMRDEFHTHTEQQGWCRSAVQMSVKWSRISPSRALNVWPRHCGIWFQLFL